MIKQGGDGGVGVEIRRAARGVPHLRADGPDALARAQGRAVAREHGGWLELRRHRAQGTSAALLGPDALSWDRFARRARLADTARRCFAALEEGEPETAGWVRAYVTGVNEGLAESTGARFGKAGFAPGRWEPWTPLAVRLSLHILATGFPAKLWREQVAGRLGPAGVALFGGEGEGADPDPGAGMGMGMGMGMVMGPYAEPDDHAGHQRLRLSCPEFDVVGLAVPGVPGLVRRADTGTVAWTFTPGVADRQDLYHERLRRTGAGVEALGPDGRWHRAARHTELVRVAGEGTVETEVIETARGPVIAGGPEGLDDGTPVALSLRYPARVTADLGFGALLPLLRARRVADVDRALAARTEPVGVVRATDTEGGTLHRGTGRVPVRAAANLVRPVPAWEPGHEWQGWREPAGAEGAGAEGVGSGDGWPDADGPLLERLAALDGLSPGAADLRDRLLGRGARGDAGGAAYAAVRSAVVRRLAAEPAFAALAAPPAYPELFQPWLALTPRVAHALGRLLRAETLYAIDRTAVLRAAVEEATAAATADRFAGTGGGG
ncbi:penicillin acylase family protein [Streptomyces sp. NPDC023723]|uniref:penicillin acylase family protein n=1 Tax=Streptomyces sp. NPDC023723 TaxID=3154323 RepID=UPI0033FAC560